MLVTRNKVGVMRSARIVILGSGFAGIEVLKKLQKEYCNDDYKEIIMISKDNFLLFTPMLPEFATSTVDTRHIVTPIRSFCKKGCATITTHEAYMPARPSLEEMQMLKMSQANAT